MVEVFLNSNKLLDFFYFFLGVLSSLGSGPCTPHVFPRNPGLICFVVYGLFPDVDRRRFMRLRRAWTVKGKAGSKR